MRIAILGAGSFVSRAILPYLLGRSDWETLLYTRAPDRLADWATEHRLPADRISIEASEAFGGRACEVIVNFVGAGDPRLVNRMGEDILPLTVEWDERVLRQLARRPSTRYVFASSGAAAGGDFKVPRRPDSPFRRPAGADHYARAKADAEQRHRTRSDLPIVDLRLYNFYSADMGAGLGYLVCNMLQAARARVTFTTDEHDIARDFLHPVDLASAIIAVLHSPPENVAYDLASIGPVRKFELLRRFRDQLSLKWEVRPSHAAANKLNYYFEGFALKHLGFMPTFSSIDAVFDQVTAFLATVEPVAQLDRI